MSEILIPHRTDSLSSEEATATIIEALDLVHTLIGSELLKSPAPDWIIARAHKFFSVQALPDDREEMKKNGCKCGACIATLSSGSTQEIKPRGVSTLYL